MDAFQNCRHREVAHGLIRRHRLPVGPGRFSGCLMEERTRQEHVALGEDAMRACHHTPLAASRVGAGPGARHGSAHTFSPACGHRGAGVYSRHDACS